MANAIRRMAEGSSRIVERYLPDAFLFAIILSFVAYGLALAFVQPSATYASHARLVLTDGWYGGFWNLLSFAMQMTLILMTGYALAQTDVVDRMLASLASRPTTEKGAAALVAGAYSGFLVWHGGLAGSIPLVMNSSADAGNFLLAGGVVSQTYATGST